MDDNDVREADVRVSSRKTPTLMRAGARVRIKGLKSRADLNGMDATVLAWMPGDRWGVRTKDAASRPTNHTQLKRL